MDEIDIIREKISDLRAQLVNSYAKCQDMGASFYNISEDGFKSIKIAIPKVIELEQLFVR